MYDGMLLYAKEVSKSYSRKSVLVDFSISVQPGDVQGVLGPNGSGKTTCLHVLTGLIGADGGDVEVCGIPISSKKSRRYYGFAPDDLQLPEMLTGSEYLAFHDSLRGRNDRQRAKVLADAFHLADDLNRPIGEYSHGMRRKLQLIASIAHDPEILILDEPYRGLDPEASALLRELIRTFASSGRGVVIATHDMLRAETDCTYVNILSRGISVARGSPQSVMEEFGPGTSFEEAVLLATGAAEQHHDDLMKLAMLFDR